MKQTVTLCLVAKCLLTSACGQFLSCNVNLIAVFFSILQGRRFKVIKQEIVFLNGAIALLWIHLVWNYEIPAIQLGHFDIQR